MATAQLPTLGHPRVWATETDALAAVDGETKRLVELIDGELVEKPLGLRESFLATFLAMWLNQFIVPRKLGLLAGPDGLWRIRPGRIRLPDLAFYRWPKPGEANVARESIASRAPALVVEILSESNTAAEMAGKRKDYFSAGCELVWIIDPGSATVDVYTDATNYVRLNQSDPLDGGSVLPGFSLPLIVLFDYLDSLPTEEA